MGLEPLKSMSQKADLFCLPWEEVTRSLQPQKGSSPAHIDTLASNFQLLKFSRAINAVVHKLACLLYYYFGMAA